jgi:ABC-type multidrug transport system fused ATPase/permease subunit
MVELRRRIYASLLELDVALFNAVPTGILIGHLSEDVALVRDTSFDKSSQIVQYSHRRSLM